MIALRPWSERREREAIVRHLARCSFCRALLAYSRRRRDRELLDAAERASYGLLITTDQNLKHQQHLGGRQLAIVVLLTTSWPRIRLRIDDIKAVVDGIGRGRYVEVAI